MDTRIVGWAYWNYDRRPDNWTSPVNTPGLVELLMRPQPSRVMGLIETIEFDPVSGVFAFSYREQSGSAQTEVRVPGAFAGRTLSIDPPRPYQWSDGPVPGLRVLEITSAESGDLIRVTLR
jgi:hypothetical protein